MPDSPSPAEDNSTPHAPLAGDAALFQQLADAMPQIVFAAQPDGHVDYFNRRWYEYTGVPQGETGFESWRHVHTPEGLERVSAVWNESLRTGKPYEIEYLLRRHDGAYRWHLGRALPVHDSGGRIVRWFGTNTDIHDQKLAEETITRARRQMQMVVRGANVGVWYCDLPFDELVWDDKVKEHFHLAPDDRVTIQTFYEHLHPDDRERTRSAIEASIANRTNYDIDYRTISSDGGDVKWIRAIGRTFYDDAGKPIRFDGVTIDVTERTRAELALRESEARFRHMSDNAPVMIWVTEPDGLCTYLNRPWYDFTGQREGEGHGLGWVNAVHPDDRQRAERAFLDANAKRARYEVDFRLRRRDGEYRWCIDSASPRFDASGGYLGYVGSVLDITDRKRAQDALRDSEERLRLAIAIAQMGTFQVDLATDAAIVNDTGRSIYGWTADEPLTFERVQSHVHPADQKRVVETLAAALRPGGPDDFEIEHRIIRAGDGEQRWLRVRWRKMFEGAGAGAARHTVRCVGTFIDVTDQKAVEQEREQLLVAERVSRAQAEHASRMKDEFLATLSHELRTPLNAILGWATILREGVADTEELQQGLDTIERNARSQTQIIEDLLDMSRIISGKVRLDVQRVDLAEVARSAIETVRHAADAKGIRIQPLLDPLAAPVSGDPNRLQQVLWNLLSNAIKFTPRGGRVQVLLSRVNSHVELSISDTGEGIAPEFLTHVFDRFRQADSSTTRTHGGLGLGLAIVKQLVELHGGTVKAASPGRGQGATFTVSLPLTVLHTGPGDDAQEQRRHPAAPVPGAIFNDACVSLAGVKVLVVDDEPDARALIQRLLEDCNAVAITAPSVEAAIEELVRQRVDVIVSDIGMPGEDGYSLIRRVRALGPDRGGNTPALALTAYARAEDRVRSIVAGFQMHVAKPVEPAELLTMVASLAGRTGSA